MRLAAAILIACICLFANEPRKAAKDYAAHAEFPTMDIGVDYMIHSFWNDGQMYFARDYLVCEVAVYPKAPVELTAGSFRLRINGSKYPIAEAGPEFVAASLRYPDWTQHPVTEISASSGDAGVTLGAPPVAPRFPGDPAAQPHYPQPTRAPEDPNKPEKPAVDAAQIVLNTALRSGPIEHATAGYLYFPWSGNLKKIKTVALVVHVSSGDRDVVLK